MPSLEMGESHEFTQAEIDRLIEEESAGNFALGRANDEGKFIVKYVGRADVDVSAELQNHLQGGYQMFKFNYALSPRSAYDKECRNYHDFGESKNLDNKIHPASGGSPCPVCTIFD